MLQATDHDVMPSAELVAVALSAAQAAAPSDPRPRFAGRHRVAAYMALRIFFPDASPRRLGPVVGAGINPTATVASAIRMSWWPELGPAAVEAAADALENTMSVWTDERVTTLKKMWVEGASCAEIARKLGADISRNAVIGKVHRLGLSGRASPAQPGVSRPDVKRKHAARAAAKAQPTSPSVPPKAPELHPAGATSYNTRFGPLPETPDEDTGAGIAALTGDKWDPLPHTHPVELLHLRAGLCKWPVGPTPDDMSQQLFCAAVVATPADVDCVYCAPHARFAYKPRPAAGKRSDKEFLRSMRRFAA